MKHINTGNVLTVRQLKEIVKEWPEVDQYGDETEVWIMNNDGCTSRAAKALYPLNWRHNEEGCEWADLIVE